MIIIYRSSDHPEANDKEPTYEDVAYTLTIPLDNGDDYLEVHIGCKGRQALYRYVESRK